MPQRGSVAVTSSNAFSASSYSKECSQATARLNCFWACGVQETGKLTRPSFSEVSCLCGPISCALAEGAWQRKAAVNNATTETACFINSPFAGQKRTVGERLDFKL